MSYNKTLKYSVGKKKRLKKLKNRSIQIKTISISPGNVFWIVNTFFMLARNDTQVQIEAKARKTVNLNRRAFFKRGLLR